MVLRPKRIETSDLRGFKYFEMITFFCDPYLSLLLLYFFSPAITSLNALQQVTELEKVRKLPGVKRLSIVSLSEAGSVFDPQPVEHIPAGQTAQSDGPVRRSG